MGRPKKDGTTTKKYKDYYEEKKYSTQIETIDILNYPILFGFNDPETLRNKKNRKMSGVL